MAPSSSSSTGRLRDSLPRRSRHHRLLGGVCGGLARTWGMSPTTVRALALVLALLPGPMWVAYAVAWVLMPLED